MLTRSRGQKKKVKRMKSLCMCILHPRLKDEEWSLIFFISIILHTVACVYLVSKKVEINNAEKTFLRREKRIRDHWKPKRYKSEFVDDIESKFWAAGNEVIIHNMRKSSSKFLFSLMAKSIKSTFICMLVLPSLMFAVCKEGYFFLYSEPCIWHGSLYRKKYLTTLCVSEQN